MSISEKKAKIRQRLLGKRQRITDEEYRKYSQSIREKIAVQPEFRDANTIHFYVAMSSRKEVDTYPLIKEALEEGVRVVVPVTDFNSGFLKHIELISMGDLSPNKWGVPEPETGEAVKLDALDLVIVPMVGGDEHRNRIGYGKGFYDRFLARVDCPTIGLCFERCIVEEIPTEPFDIRLNKIVTESKVIE